MIHILSKPTLHTLKWQLFFTLKKYSITLYILCKLGLLILQIF